MDVSVRAATAIDADRLVELCRQLGYVKSAAEVAQSISDLNATRRDHVWVAEQETGFAVGWIHLTLATSLTTGWYGVIVGLVVDEAYRSHGIGRALVLRAIETAREAGVGHMRVRSQAARVEAHRFYRSVGFEDKKEQKVFDLNLS